MFTFLPGLAEHETYFAAIVEKAWGIFKSQRPELRQRLPNPASPISSCTFTGL
jgi:hypothetical protein